MPIYKTEILGNKIEINYEKNDLEKLTKLINKFQERLNEFPNKDRINKSTVIFLAALKAEDQLEEIKSLLDNQSIIIDQNHNKNLTIEKLNKEIINLNDKLSNLNSSNASEKNNSKKIFNEIEKLDIDLKSIQKKIKDSINY
tara:strand:- start:558 stop:983 length:426 start_codon:yes stop_codon:yes gene_type:complete